MFALAPYGCHDFSCCAVILSVLRSISIILRATFFLPCFVSIVALIFAQRRAKPMAGEYVEGNFLGLSESIPEVDVVILSLPYELTTSYGEGTAEGPAACIAASAQVEIYDSLLSEDLPAGVSIHTAREWDGSGDSLLAQLDSITSYLQPWFVGDCFPIVLGGEHGILPAVMQAQSTSFSEMTIVQIDAHADLRSQLNGEKWSHACAAARTLEMGIGRLIQIGVRAYSREEAEVIENDSRVQTFFARDLMSPCDGTKVWQELLAVLSSITGPVHLSIDIDGMDGALVPDTGTPVAGGLQMWHAVEAIEVLFANPSAKVISSDVNEIVPGKDSPLTQFTAAMLATKVLACHIHARQEGRWHSPTRNGKERPLVECDYFQSLPV